MQYVKRINLLLHKIYVYMIWTKLVNNDTPQLTFLSEGWWNRQKSRLKYDWSEALVVSFLSSFALLYMLTVFVVII